MVSSRKLWWIFDATEKCCISDRRTEIRSAVPPVLRWPASWLNPRSYKYVCTSREECIKVQQNVYIFKGWVRNQVRQLNRDRQWHCFLLHFKEILVISHCHLLFSLLNNFLTCIRSFYSLLLGSQCFIVFMYSSNLVVANKFLFIRSFIHSVSQS